MALSRFNNRKAVTMVTIYLVDLVALLLTLYCFTQEVATLGRVLNDLQSDSFQTEKHGAHLVSTFPGPNAPLDI